MVSVMRKMHFKTKAESLCKFLCISVNKLYLVDFLITPTYLNYEHVLNYGTATKGHSNTL